MQVFSHDCDKLVKLGFIFLFWILNNSFIDYIFLLIYFLFLVC